MLKVWFYVRKLLPDAELNVYYGFGKVVDEQMKRLAKRNSHGQFHNDSTTEQTPKHANSQQAPPPPMTLFEDWKDYMMRLMDELDGVNYHGTVDHITLQRAYFESGYLLYPTQFSETGCITCIKAMISGCIPITSRYKQSVLGNLRQDAAGGEATEAIYINNISDLKYDGRCSMYDYFNSTCVSIDSGLDETDLDPYVGLTAGFDLGPDLAWSDEHYDLSDDQFTELLFRGTCIQQDGTVFPTTAWINKAGANTSLMMNIYHQLLLLPHYKSYITGEVSITRFDRWLYVHYLPSVVYAVRKHGLPTKLDDMSGENFEDTGETVARRHRNSLMEYTSRHYNWKNSARILVDHVSQ